MNRTDWKAMWTDKRRRKPYLVAILLAVLYAVEIFFVSGILGMQFGLLGTVLHELLLALIGIVVFKLLHGRMRMIYPFRKPKWSGIFGTLLLWIGVWLAAMLATMLLTFFFPQEVTEASSGVDALIDAMPLWMSIFVVAAEPAVCEELAFRGALLGCLRGAESKWVGIVLTALVFGACHGSIWRMVPTAILGIAMGYILVETDNLIYSMLFHFINNAVPVLLLGFVSWLEQALFPEGTEAAAESVRVSMGTVGVYVILAASAPMLIYIGRHFLHSGRPGYEKGLFPADRKREMAALIGAGIAMAAVGLFMIAVSTAIQSGAGMQYGY